MTPFALPELLEQKLSSLCTALRQFESIFAQGIALSKGALLSGESAFDKVELARWIARQSNCQFLAVGPSDVRPGMIGQAARDVHDMFERARKLSPCILFIGELDAVTPSRGSPKWNSSSMEIVSQWLMEQDRLRQTAVPFVFIVAATDRIEFVDPAVRGRLDRIDMPAASENS